MEKLKPSKKHYLTYDANTFENHGFKVLSGDISRLAMTPRYWSVSVQVMTEDYDGSGKMKDHFSFKTKERCMLSDLRDRIKQDVLDNDDYMPVCTACIVTARVMM